MKVGGEKLKAIIFDWGDTLMHDFPEFKGAMFYWPHVELMPGVKNTLAQLHTEYICCVASNAGDSNADLMGSALGRVSVKEYFRYLFTSKELGFSKPDINFFTEIMSRIGVAADECIMVGNDYNKDIIPAKKAGMHTILVSADTKGIEMNHADVIISTMDELCNALKLL